MRFKALTWITVTLIVAGTLLCAWALWLDRMKDFMLIASFILNVLLLIMGRTGSEADD